MNSKVRFIPLIVLGAIILSLIAVIPAFSDTGQLRFWMMEDPDEDQEWAMAGGMVYLEVDDSDLDVPVKYVILPDEMEPRGMVDAMVGSAVVEVASSTDDLVVGDTVIVEGNTIREVTDIDGLEITLNRVLSMGGNNQSLYEVTHPDANVDDCPACASAEMATVEALGYIDLDNAPVADSGVKDLGNRFDGSKDSRTSSRDVYLADMNGGPAGITIQQVNNDEDRVEVAESAVGQMVYVVYWGSDENDTGSTVDVRSSSDSDGITVVLTETGSSTGVFRGSIMLTDEGDSDADAIPPVLRVNPSGSVTFRYDDDGTRRSKSIDVETTRPVLSNFSPAHNTAGQDDRPEVMAEVTDSDSGVEDSGVYIVFARLDGTTVEDGKAVSVNVDEGSGRLRSITGGLSVEQRLPDELEEDGDATIAWWVVAQDVAGNVAVSDQNADSDCVPNDSDGYLFPGLSVILNEDYTDGDPVGVGDLDGLDVSAEGFMSGCQPFIVKIDETDPAVTGSRSGAFWDTSKDDDNKTNMDANAAKATSILVEFSEALDSSSVSADDFEVDGAAPLDAAHYSAASSYVFLTVPALDAHDKPEVELVGEVSDPAGNTANAGTTGVDDGLDSVDGIAPTLTVALAGVTTGDRPVSDGKITITVETDENTSNPSVMISKVTAATADGKGLLTGAPEALTPKVKRPRVYEGTSGALDAGLYSVYVTASDGPNTGTAGASYMMMMVDHDSDEDTAMVSAYSPVDLSSDTSALLFEVDKSGPEFALNPEESDDANAFIQVDFGAEGNEYPATVKDAGDDGYYGTADDGADTDDTLDLDSYGMVTILSSTLAGDDITPERLGDASFLFAAPDLAVGEYKVKIDAEDSAGNDMESEMTLKITERKPFSLNIRAGVSLISFPGDPADPDINAVFPADHPVQEIATYDPTMPGKWFASQRDESTGMLDGNLLTISGNQAYLVRSESSKPLSVVIIRRSAHETIIPPQIDLVKGWNLVPVLDVTYGLSDGDDIGYMTYFGDNGNIDRVYGVDTIRNRLVLVESDDNLKVGKGYWVFASAATSVAPGTAADDE